MGRRAQFRPEPALGLETADGVGDKPSLFAALRAPVEMCSDGGRRDPEEQLGELFVV
jgi:hypothetical protein